MVAASLQAQTVTESFTGINTAIPDGDISGLVNAQTITGHAGLITDVNLTLTVSGTGYGAVNGDIYAYLSHEGQIAVLLNRSGRRTGNGLGYDDSGFAGVTFDDAAPNGDVHNYRFTLFGDHDTAITPIPSPLEGIWAPDGRNVSPLTALDGSPRSNPLSVFNGTSPNGTWTLFLADVELGGTARLDSWSLELTMVPEPQEVALAVGLGLVTFVGWRARRRRA